jgi:hypothetical protein
MSDVIAMSAKERQQQQNNKRNICYCRVSTSSQKEDLERQVEYFRCIAVTGKDWRDKHSKNPYENCISMKDFPQPFFEYHKKVNWFEDVSSDKKPYKNTDWVKTKSTRTKGLYYYFDPKKQITQFNRPVDYSSDEEDMSEDEDEDEDMSDEVEKSIQE